MDSYKDEILIADECSQPALMQLHDLRTFIYNTNNLAKRFVKTVISQGGRIMSVNSVDEIRDYVVRNMSHSRRNITTVSLLNDLMEYVYKKDSNPHLLQEADNVLIEAQFGVAENAAVWVTGDMLMLRVLPFFCQHLTVIVNANDIVPTMYETYWRIGDTNYVPGSFVVDPSKANDIEQSLVLGLPGSRTVTILLIEQINSDINDG